MDISDIIQKLAAMGILNREPEMSQQVEQPTSTVDEALGVNPLDEFRYRIGGVESSFGKNLKHPLVTSGIQAGDKAIGKYAMMPNTVQEFAGRMGNEKLKNIPKELYPDYFKHNPKEYDKMADFGMEYVLNKFKDPDVAAYAWNQGHNLDPESITPEKLAKSDYVMKFKKIKDHIK